MSVLGMVQSVCECAAARHSVISVVGKLALSVLQIGSLAQCNQCVGQASTERVKCQKIDSRSTAADNRCTHPSRQLTYIIISIWITWIEGL